MPQRETSPGQKTGRRFNVRHAQYARELLPAACDLSVGAEDALGGAFGRAADAALGADAVVLDELRGCIDATLRAGCAVFTVHEARAFLKSGELAGVFGVAHGGACGFGDVGGAGEAVDADGEVADRGHDAGAVGGADL